MVEAVVGQKKETFEERRQSDPQGLIDDLVKQTTRQGKAIHDLTKANEDLQKKIAVLEKEKAE
jgi:hypothetical protein